MSVAELLHPDPRYVQPRDVPKFVAEAHKRVSGPLTAASFAMVALVSVLSGAFRRHGGVLRPLVSILTIVGLLALGLVVGNLAARNSVLVPLIWLHATLPGLACAFYLYWPELRPSKLGALLAAHTFPAQT